MKVIYRWRDIVYGLRRVIYLADAKCDIFLSRICVTER